ncbi:MAG: hypothetical protein ACR2JB_27960 [Bryobacteraceae bacterium]
MRTQQMIGDASPGVSSYVVDRGAKQDRQQRIAGESIVRPNGRLRTGSRLYCSVDAVLEISVPKSRSKQALRLPRKNGAA